MSRYHEHFHNWNDRDPNHYQCDRRPYSDSVSAGGEPGKTHLQQIFRASLDYLQHAPLFTDIPRPTGTRSIAQYRRIEQIGEGTYGQVYKAVCLATNRLVALKKIRFSNVFSEGLPRNVIREIKILKALRHPNMVEMIEVVSSKGFEELDDDDEHKNMKRSRDRGAASSGNDEDTDLLSSRSLKSTMKKDRIIDAREKYKGNLFLVLEYVSHDLSGILDMGYRFSQVQSKCIFRQLLLVLDYMHENKYVHRDLKSSNILIDDRFRIKLADYGLARSIAPPLFDNGNDERSNQEFTNKVVTLWYRAPELLLGATRYDEKIDVWSAGCILAELLLGKALFTGKSEMEQLQLIFNTLGTPDESSWDGLKSYVRIRSGEVVIDPITRPSKLREKYGGADSKIGPSALGLIERMLELDPKKRIRAGRALDSQYFLSHPVAPEHPEELGFIELGGDSHEFQTKPIRKEAKIAAQKASAQAKAQGKDEKNAYETAYQQYLNNAVEARLTRESTVNRNVSSVRQSHDKTEAIDNTRPGICQDDLITTVKMKDSVMSELGVNPSVPSNKINDSLTEDHSNDFHMNVSSFKKDVMKPMKVDKSGTVNSSVAESKAGVNNRIHGIHSLADSETITSDKVLLGQLNDRDRKRASYNSYNEMVDQKIWRDKDKSSQGGLFNGKTTEDLDYAYSNNGKGNIETKEGRKAESVTASKHNARSSDHGQQLGREQITDTKQSNNELSDGWEYKKHRDKKDHRERKRSRERERSKKSNERDNKLPETTAKDIHEDRERDPNSSKKDKDGNKLDLKQHHNKDFMEHNDIIEQTKDRRKEHKRQREKDVVRDRVRSIEKEPSNTSYAIDKNMALKSIETHEKSKVKGSVTRDIRSDEDFHKLKKQEKHMKSRNVDRKDKRVEERKYENADSAEQSRYLTFSDRSKDLSHKRSRRSPSIDRTNEREFRREKRREGDSSKNYRYDSKGSGGDPKRKHDIRDSKDVVTNFDGRLLFDENLAPMRRQLAYAQFTGERYIDGIDEARQSRRRDHQPASPSLYRDPVYIERRPVPYERHMSPGFERPYLPYTRGEDRWLREHPYAEKIDKHDEYFESYPASGPNRSMNDERRYVRRENMNYHRDDDFSQRNQYDRRMR